jgi:hypothetical protein
MRFDAVLFDLSGTLINYRGSVVGWEAMERLGFTAVCDLLHSNGHRDKVPDVDLFHSAAFQHLTTAWQDTISGRRNLHLQELLCEAAQAQGVTLNGAIVEQAVLKYTGAISAGATPCDGAEGAANPERTGAEAWPHLEHDVARPPAPRRPRTLRSGIVP